MLRLIRWALVPLVLVAISAATDGGKRTPMSAPGVSLPPAPNVSAVDAPGTARAVAAAPAWLRRVNQYRKLAALPLVTSNAIWGEGARLHARYMVKNGQVTHFEDPSNPWFTKAGEIAGRYGNVMGAFDMSSPDTWAVDYWMQGPFHSIGILHPKLTKVGFGSYRENVSWYAMAATLDVIRGRNYQIATTYPVKFPAGPTPVPIRQYVGGEHPNPLTSCPGYTAPSGLPIMLLLGNGRVTPRVTAHTLKVDGAAVAHCIYDETNYRNPNADDQSLGRASLGQSDAVVIIPKAPLQRGKTYTVSVTTNGKRHTWTFKVATTAP